MSEPPRPNLLDVGEVAFLLGLSGSTVRRRIAHGEIPAMRVGNSPKAPIRVDRRDLDVWLKQHRTKVDA